MKRLTLAALLTALFAGCGFLDDSREYSHDIFPLAVGNSWIYRYTASLNGEIETTHIYQVEIIGTKMIPFEGSDLKVFVQRYSNSTGARLYDQFLRSEADGLYRYGKGLLSAGKRDVYQRRLLVRYPIYVGDEWRVDHGDYFDEYVCLSTSKPYATPAGEFITYQFGHRFGYELYAPEIGYVGSEGEIQLSDGVHAQREELIEYDVR